MTKRSAAKRSKVAPRAAKPLATKSKKSSVSARGKSSVAKAEQSVNVYVGGKRGGGKAASSQPKPPIFGSQFTPYPNWYGTPYTGYPPAPVGVPQTVAAPAPVGVKVSQREPRSSLVDQPLALAALPRGAPSSASVQTVRSTEIAIPPRRDFPADPRALSGEEPRIQRDVFVPPPPAISAEGKYSALPEGETAGALNLAPTDPLPLFFISERLAEEPPRRVQFSGVGEAELAAAALPAAPEEEGFFSGGSSITSEIYEPLFPPPEPPQKRAQIEELRRSSSEEVTVAEEVAAPIPFTAPTVAEEKPSAPPAKTKKARAPKFPPPTTEPPIEGSFVPAAKVAKEKKQREGGRGRPSTAPFAESTLSVASAAEFQPSFIVSEPTLLQLGGAAQLLPKSGESTASSITAPTAETGRWNPTSLANLPPIKPVYSSVPTAVEGESSVRSEASIERRRPKPSAELAAGGISFVGN